MFKRSVIRQYSEKFPFSQSISVDCHNLHLYLIIGSLDALFYALARDFNDRNLLGDKLDFSIWSLISILCFIPAIVIHEVSHGFVANKMGDPTARYQGRLSLNPLKHIDPFGTVLLPVMLALLGLPVFGYAKPVPYNPNNFKDVKKGELLTGLAGPASNLIMALASALIATLLLLIVPEVNEALNWTYNILFYFALINLYLMFFNLIPIPPLDGSSIIAVFLSRKALQTYYQIQQYSLPILMIILVVLPMVLHFNPLGVYMNVTAGNIAQLLFPGML